MNKTLWGRSSWGCCSRAARQGAELAQAIHSELAGLETLAVET